MKTALFTNYSDQPFDGWWDGKKKTFAPGQSVYMPDYLAQHFAKHLANRELLRVDTNGQPLYPNGEKFTSPKKPKEVPIYMELFNKAYHPDTDEEFTGEKDSIDVQIEVANKNRQERERRKALESASSERKKEVQDPTKPQVVLPPDFAKLKNLFSKKQAKIVVTNQTLNQHTNDGFVNTRQRIWEVILFLLHTTQFQSDHFTQWKIWKILDLQKASTCFSEE
jgi:hypothetical protein